jgi:hypothetical protein
VKLILSFKPLVKDRLASRKGTTVYGTFEAKVVSDFYRLKKKKKTAHTL